MDLDYDDSYETYGFRAGLLEPLLCEPEVALFPSTGYPAPVQTKPTFDPSAPGPLYASLELSTHLHIAPSEDEDDPIHDQEDSDSGMSSVRKAVGFQTVTLREGSFE